MEPADLLRLVAETLERLEIDYFVTGSTATIAYGEPRFTNDIDVVVDLPPGFASPEDVILKKLAYFQEGGSEKHLRDIAGVLRVRGEQLDRAYIERWADRLSLSAIWQQVLKRANE